MSKRFILMLAAIAALAGIAGGCGGSDGDEEPLTKAQFTKQANGICQNHTKQLKAELTAYAKKGPSGSPEARRIRVSKTVLLPGIDSEMVALEGLAAPDGDEEQVSAIVDAGRSGLEQAEAEPDKILGVESSALEQFQKLAFEYGLTTCGPN